MIEWEAAAERLFDLMLDDGTARRVVVGATRPASQPEYAIDEKECP